MSDRSDWLEQIKPSATILSEAYRLRLKGLWWLNQIFVVLPAVLTTTAAIVAAIPTLPHVYELPLASIFAGGSAVLMSIHKALKCDEYQAECLRLSQAYQAIALAADIVLLGPEGKRDSHQERLTNKLEVLAESAKAMLPTRHIRRAESISGVKLYNRSAA